MGVLGIDLGGSNLRVGLVENNCLVKIESLPINKNENEDAVLNSILSLIKCFSNERIEGIGIGVPSIVDIEKGIVYDVQNIPSCKEIHLKDFLQDKFNLPVYINNDANCFVMGEKYFGKAKKFNNIVGLIIGTGLGAGIIINNNLYTGNNCGAGEFGMIQYKNKNYEYFCSGQYFINEYQTKGEKLFELAKNGDNEATRIFSEFGSNIGEAIKAILYSIDPEIIVLGGSVSKSFKYFKNEMLSSMSDFAYSRTIDKIKIEVSEENNISVLGAASLCYNEFH